MKRSEVLAAIVDNARAEALMAIASGDPGAIETALCDWELASDAWLIAVKIEMDERRSAQEVESEP